MAKGQTKREEERQYKGVSFGKQTQTREQYQGEDASRRARKEDPDQQGQGFTLPEGFTGEAQEAQPQTQQPMTDEVADYGAALRTAADMVSGQQDRAIQAASGMSGSTGFGAPDGAPSPYVRQKIGEKEVLEAAETLRKYKEGKANLDQRIVENEQWFKLRHWDQLRKAPPRPGEVESVSAWLFNSLINRHADAMDSFPQPNVLPREESDRQEAKILSSILPVVMERAGFEQTYSDVQWYKLKAGTGAYGVFWNGDLENGLGDIDIRKLDVLDIFWEPGISDIQESRNLFIVKLVDRDLLEQQYPQCKDRVGISTIDTAQYIYDDTVDTSDKAAVVDWYYKVGRPGGGHVLQYCKFCDGVVLYASENIPEYQESGYYEHGKYPVVFDTCFREEGTPAGFGYLDIMKSPQITIDLLTGAITKNAILHAKTKYLIRNDAGINKDQLSDPNSDFVECANISEDQIREIQMPIIGDNTLSTLQFKVDEIKETSGNRDFSQGSTASGVTAASAIAALQEAGSKTARDMNKSSYRAFREISYLCIDLIRQFYDEPRKFRITGQFGDEQFVQYDNRNLRDQISFIAGQEMARKPIFDIKVTAEKASPFSQVSQNELAKELYQLGFFNPQLADQALTALEMMDFEAKTMVTQKIQQNGTMYQQLTQLTQLVQQMAGQMDLMAGNPIDAEEGQTPPADETGSGGKSTGSDGNYGEDAVAGGTKKKGSLAAQARVRAANATTPR